jgi:arylsulfatase A-like enzyme
VLGSLAAQTRLGGGSSPAARGLASVALIAASAGLILASTSCGQSTPGDVVLITVDTLRPDHLGIYGYERPTSPHIDGFFAPGTVYERAYSTTASTGPSVVSLLSGRLPHEHRVRILYQLVGEEVALVTDLLPEAYQKAAFVSNIVLTDEALGIADRFDHYDDYIDERESARAVWERSAARTTDAALAWLAQARDPERPLFLWIHYIDPHGPYRPPEQWAESFEHAKPKMPFKRQRILGYMAEYGFDDAWRYVDRYDDEIAYVDSEIGRLLDSYGNRLDEALVILTADHGETMIEQERWFTHGYHVYEPIVRVPLMLRGPGVAKRRVSAPTQGTDVAPTVLRFAGVTVPDAMPAVDLRSGEGLDPGRPIVVEATTRERQWRALIQDREKWSVDVRGDYRKLARRLHQSVDEEGAGAGRTPWDDSNPGARALLELVESDPDPAGVPRSYERGEAIKSPKVDPRIGSETLEKLRSLGYAE